ncbi:MAG: hypothetical protein DMD96_09980 [Candidatus Rokuibacteriota bacterium]|nr:MAG: hypothetical protein DMD96_09980 [Candidatus Rokubacteria bacterium]
MSRRGRTVEWIAMFGLGALSLVGAAGARAESPARPAAPAATASLPSSSAYESLSPGNRRIANALFTAQKSSPAATQPMTLDQIAQERRSGKSWGEIFQAMKSQGLIQGETLAQVLGRYDRARHTQL